VCLCTCMCVCVCVCACVRAYVFDWAPYVSLRLRGLHTYCSPKSCPVCNAWEWGVGTELKEKCKNIWKIIQGSSRQFYWPYHFCRLSGTINAGGSGFLRTFYESETKTHFIEVLATHSLTATCPCTRAKIHTHTHTYTHTHTHTHTYTHTHTHTHTHTLTHTHTGSIHTYTHTHTHTYTHTHTHTHGHSSQLDTGCAPQKGK
jgi:hypothetical protein